MPAGCGDDDKSSDSAGTSTGGTKAGKVAVLLADSKSSVRWETVDRPLRKSPGDVAEVALFALTRPRGMRLMTTTFRPMSEASWG